MSKADRNDLVSILSAAPDDKTSVNHQTWKSECCEGPIRVSVDGFGFLDLLDGTEPEIVHRFTFSNKNRMRVQVITYGATITSMKVPNKYGVPEDVVMGFDDMFGYLHQRNYFGCTVGRCCNRVGNATFFTNGAFHKLSQNDNDHHYNGGVRGFDKYNWTPYLKKAILTLTHVSECGTEGYPGTVMVRATFELKNDNTFRISYAATTSLPTMINLTSSSFFNLAGHSASHTELYKHIVTLNADRTICQDDQHLPTGRVQCVGGTVMDLRIPHELGPAIARCPGGGYDQYMCLTQGTEQTMTFAARIIHPESGRVMELYTDQPGFHFSTGNCLPDPYDNINPKEVYTQDFYELPGTISKISKITKSFFEDELRSMEECDEEIDENEEFDQMARLGPRDRTPSCSCFDGSRECICLDLQTPIMGKKGATYMRHGGFCLNTQQYPDAMNHIHFPNTIIQPGQMYSHEIVYKFGLHMGAMTKVKSVLCEEYFGEEFEHEMSMDEDRFTNY